MTDKDARRKIDDFIAQLDAEELEEKIAPVDCNKKPNHPDCQAKTLYGGPVTKYGGPTTRYGGP